jgi:hypothetical protein
MNGEPGDLEESPPPYFVCQPVGLCSRPVIDIQYGRCGSAPLRIDRDKGLAMGANGKYFDRILHDVSSDRSSNRLESLPEFLWLCLNPRTMV